MPRQTTRPISMSRSGPQGARGLLARRMRASCRISSVLAAARAVAEYNAVDQAVSDTIQRYWTNFARTGDPNGTRPSCVAEV